MKDIETEVLVVGAGLTGATAALLLARHKIDTVMISRAAWAADSPRAHIVNQRTMEVMRAVGLEAACIKQASPGELMANLVMVNTLSGREFARLWSFGNNPSRLGEYRGASPSRICDLPQDRFEPILVGEAMRLGVKTRFRTKFTGLAQDADGVTATVEDLVADETYRIRCRYLIGADGGQSPIATAIGLPFAGNAGLANAVNVHFTADLSRYTAHRPGSLYWVLQPGREGALGNASLRMVRPWHEWIGAFVHMGEAVMNLSHAELIGEIRRLIDNDTVEIKIKGVYPWRINHVVAERYSERRVFCAGDAVHRHPPTNALGGNTCIQDAFNLVWKLAAVLRWGAGPALLDTFNAERQPIGKQVVDRAIASLRLNPEIVRAFGIDRDATPEERQAAFDVFFEESDAGEARRAAVWRAVRAREYNVHAHGVEMNQVYASSAVVNDGVVPPAPMRDYELHYQATTFPGARLPHCWVEHEGQTCSTLDLAKPERFTLLARNRGRAWLKAAAELAPQLPFELAAMRIGPGCEVSDLYGEWADLSEIGETGALLIRPDQHIAWRCKASTGNERETLRTVLAQCLARDIG